MPDIQKDANQVSTAMSGMKINHADMIVEWRCIQSAAVCFVYTLEEQFSRHAIHNITAHRTRLYTGNACYVTVISLHLLQISPDIFHKLCPYRIHYEVGNATSQSHKDTTQHGSLSISVLLLRANTGTKTVDVR